MPTCILRITRDREEYVLWSTVVDAPMSGVLDRDGCVSALLARGESADDDRFKRADETGSSWTFDADGYDSSILFEQRGTVRREVLREFVMRIDNDEPVDDLITPFEDRELS